MHEMRRKDRLLDRADAEDILKCGEYGVLSTFGEDGFPYGIPVNYVYENETVWFHCTSAAGHRQENLLYCPNVCFTVVGASQILPEQFSDAYRSAICFGTAEKVASEQEKNAALTKLVEKYSPDYPEKGQRYIERSAHTADVYRITVTHISGKAR